MQFEKKEKLIIAGAEEDIYGMIEVGEYALGYFSSKNTDPDYENEDALFYMTTNSGMVFGIADGAGGHAKGKEASEIASKEIVNSQAFFNSSDVNPLHVIERINNKVLDLKVGARSTLLFIQIDQNVFRSYSVGDSEVIYWNGLGAQVYSNIPHSTVGYRVQAGDLSQEKSLEQPDRNIVTNLIGDDSIRIEATSAMELKKGHTILVGTDGLFDNISHNELSGLATSGAFEKSFDNIVQKCLNRKNTDWIKDDDIAFVLLRKMRSET